MKKAKHPESSDFYSLMFVLCFLIRKMFMESVSLEIIDILENRDKIKRPLLIAIQGAQGNFIDIIYKL